VGPTNSHGILLLSQILRQNGRFGKQQKKKKELFNQGRAPDEWLRALQPLGTDANKPFLEIAPCLIGIFLKKTTADESGIARKNYYTSESVGIATGILITALHLAGLATLTHTPSPMNFLNKILGRPESERPFLLFSFTEYPAACCGDRNFRVLHLYLVTGYPSKEAMVPTISKYKLNQIATFD